MKPNFKLLAVVLCATRVTTAVFGQTTNIWTGAGDGTNFVSAANWGGLLPNPDSNDTVEFNGVVPANLLLSFSTGFPETLGVSGLNIYLTGSQTGLVTIDNFSSLPMSANFPIDNITVDSGAGAFTLGGATSSHSLSVIARPNGVVHQLINNSTNPVTINPNVQLRAGGGATYTLDFSGTGNWVVNNYLENSGGPAQFIQVDGPGTMIWNPAGNFVGGGIASPVRINGGTIILHGPHPHLNSQGITNNGTFKFDAPAQAQTLSGAISGSGSLVVSNGTLTLSGANTYGGATTVSGGSLTFQGSKTGSGDIIVANGAALGVTENGTQVTPGTMTLGSGSGCTLEFNNVTNTSTAPLAAGTVSSAGTTTININSGTFTAGQSYPLLTWTSGTAPAVSVGTVAGAVGNLSTNGNTIQFNVTSVTPPTLNFTQPSGNNIQFSWTGSFKLQSQTNSLNTGLGTNWSDYPGGGTSPVTVPIAMTNGAVFFRLLSTP